MENKKKKKKIGSYLQHKVSIRNSQNQGSVNEHCPSHLINSHAYPRREQGTEPISSAAARVPWSFQDVTDVPSIPYDEDTLTVCVLFWPASGELLRAPPHLMGDAFHPPQVPWICRVVPRDEAADVCTRLLMYGNDAHRITSRGNQKKRRRRKKWKKSRTPSSRGVTWGPQYPDIAASLKSCLGNPP